VHLSAVKPECRCEQGDGLGGLLRRRRRELGLTMREAASGLGVRRYTLSLMEQGRQEPADRLYPKLIQFLGCEPWPAPTTFGEHLRAERRRRGLASAPAAGIIGIGPPALRQIEAGEIEPSATQRAKLAGFLALPADP
jgi:transcriptional regulator with XRE-family HTH domain